MLLCRYMAAQSYPNTITLKNRILKFSIIYYLIPKYSYKFVFVNKLLWLLPVGFLAWFAYTRKKFTFNLVGFKLKPKPALVMAVYNPTSEQSTISSIVADVSYKGNRLGIIQQFNPITIKSNQRTSITLPLQADAVGFAVLLQQVYQNAQSLTQNAVISVDGTVNVSGIPVSFNQTFKLT